MKIINITIQVVFITLLLAVAALFLLPLLPIDNNIQLRIVESGSMEPSIMTGSLVVIVPASEYKVGDVVTFKSTSADVPTTHRIIESSTEANNTIFTTKGDANEEADSAVAAAKDVIGRVVVDVPYAGFILDFARQPIGFSLLILLPAFMMILSEIEKIWLEVRGRRKLTTELDDNDDEESDDEGLTDFIMPVGPRARMMDVGTPVQYRILPTLDLRHKKPLTQPLAAATRKTYMSEWATICLVLIGSSIFVSASFLPSTVSYFNDIERSFDNTLKAVMLDFTVSSELNSFNFLGTSLDSENSSVINVVEPEKGSSEARYNIEVEFTGGSALFCAAIVADMTVLPTVYTGPLLALSASDVNFTGPWSLVLSLDENITDYTSVDFCQVDIVYTAWNQNTASDFGYFDEERISITFNASTGIGARSLPSAALLLLSTASSTASTSEEVLEENNEEILPPTDEVLPTLPAAEEIIVPTDVIPVLVEEIDEVIEEVVVEVIVAETIEEIVEEEIEIIAEPII